MAFPRGVVVTNLSNAELPSLLLGLQAGPHLPHTPTQGSPRLLARELSQELTYTHTGFPVTSFGVSLCQIKIFNLASSQAFGLATTAPVKCLYVLKCSSKVMRFFLPDPLRPIFWFFYGFLFLEGGGEEHPQLCSLFRCLGFSKSLRNFSHHTSILQKAEPSTPRKVPGTEEEGTSLPFPTAAGSPASLRWLHTA